MWAIAIKEFRQLRRDRRSGALMVMAPLLLLLVFGFAARFDVDQVPTVILGEGASELEARSSVIWPLYGGDPGADARGGSARAGSSPLASFPVGLAVLPGLAGP